MAKLLIGYSACPLTRAAFEAQGHDVWTCDLLPARDGSSSHLQCDIWDVANEAWDLGIFHPMCTLMNNASAWALKDPDYDRYPDVGYHQRLKPETLRGKDRRDQQQVEFENFKRLLALPYPVAIENPAPSMISTAIRPPDQIVHPYMFGDDASKGTGLWLTKGVPKLVETQYAPPRFVCGCGVTYYRQTRGLHLPAHHECPGCDGVHKAKPRWANQTDSAQNNLPPGPERWLERSKTYPGIAAAFGKQWGRWLCSQSR